MKALVCEMCGSHDIIKNNGYYVCQSCETKYTPEEARKLIVEGTVKIDNSDRLTNLYQAARNAREFHNYAQAKTYYTEILSLEPNSWEAAFYSVYCVVADCKIIQIESAAAALRNAAINTCKIIDLSVENKTEAKLEVAKSSIALATVLHDGALSHFNSSLNNHPKSYNLYSGWLKEYENRAIGAANVCFGVGELIESTSSSLAVFAWKKGITFISNWYLLLDKGSKDLQYFGDALRRYESKVVKYESSYSIPTPDYSIYS